MAQLSVMERQRLGAGIPVGVHLNLSLDTRQTSDR
jgi:hypothetical protein